MLFVVRLGKNRRAVARRARELLATHDLNVLGVVVNEAPSVGLTATPVAVRAASATVAVLDVEVVAPLSLMLTLTE